MKKFLAVYQASPESMKQMAAASEEQKAAGMEGWMKWKANHEDSIVDFGAPVMSVGVLGDAKSVVTTSGFSILQAENLEALKAVCVDHPHQDIEFFEFIQM